ncbi:hypothetical protein NDU88_004283 [Pleurodeles waltl]|uniref:Uncharacterized protein n=1 Tax=Pleurodeles waltl TaxID=8319 RepID=A0AAV7UIN5_PLEWA|nr:hypothetical protein NDU88_004283 [Pleurodeles waltl]
MAPLAPLPNTSAVGPRVCAMDPTSPVRRLNNGTRAQSRGKQRATAHLGPHRYQRANPAKPQVWESAMPRKSGPSGAGARNSIPLEQGTGNGAAAHEYSTRRPVSAARHHRPALYASFSGSPAPMRDVPDLGSQVKRTKAARPDKSRQCAAPSTWHSCTASHGAARPNLSQGAERGPLQCRGSGANQLATAHAITAMSGPPTGGGARLCCGPHCRGPRVHFSAPLCRFSSSAPVRWGPEHRG